MFLPELAVDTSVPVAYCFITLVAWDKCYAYWLVLKVYNRFRWCSTTYLYSMIIICMHRTKEPTSFWLSTLVKVQHPATAWRVVHKSPSFMVGCIYILIYYHLHTILMWTELLHSCILTYTLLIVIIFLLMIDCHNNTFLAVRVFDNNKVDHVYTEFFLTGMIVMYYKTCWCWLS